MVNLAHLIQTASSLPTDASALESAISALEREITALESSSVPWEHRLPWFTAVVALGVAMELWIIWHDRREGMHAWSRGIICWPPGRPSFGKFIVEIVSVLLITGGIVGELWTGVKITSINGSLRSKGSELRAKSDHLIALLNIEAGNANKTAGEAKERAGGLEKVAARLRKEAEDEHAARVKLEKQIAPRRLTLDQQVKIAENCTRFKNLFERKRIKVVSYTLDTEAAILGEQIVGALRASGMVVDDSPMTITPISTFVFGINVFGSDSELAKEIADAIGSSGRPIAVSFVGNDPTAGQARFESSIAVADEVTVLIGLKPYDRNTVNELKRIMKTRMVNP